MDNFSTFAAKLAEHVVQNNSMFTKVKDTKVSVLDNDKQVSLELTPFDLPISITKTKHYFSNVKSYKDLVVGYVRLLEDFKFEVNNPRLHSQISTNGLYFGKNILGQGYSKFNDETAILIANWISELDEYCAVKSLESLLNSKADLALLKISKFEGFDVHFDHMAIRCGASSRGDAREVADLLIKHHGYSAPQIPDEAHYIFPDGWSAFPLYKMLENGQVMRVFVDQSDDDKQIIQFWNYVYGFTAHHIAMRATRVVNGERKDVPLEELTDLLNKHGQKTMQPTGVYTNGLLKQLFTKPEREEELPNLVLTHVNSHWPDIANQLKNGKLLEVVSRTEMSKELAEEFYSLYGITYDPLNHNHSVPIYQYFLPAQAQHVINTSIIVDKS